MRVSGNELVVTVTKACIGVGVPRGVAQEMGTACLQLSLAGKPALVSLLAALKHYSADVLRPDWQQVDEVWKAENLNALPFGPSMIDFALLSEAEVLGVDYPDLVWGLAKAAGFEFEFQQDGEKLNLSISDTPAASARSKAINGCEVDAEEWAALGVFAAKILVPADDTNRADAGAGLTDND